MIHTARKVFALLLVAAFTAGFAQPLVWCVSGSGHSRIEFKIGGNGHGNTMAEVAPERHAECEFPNWSLADNDCIDSDFFPEFAEASASDWAATASLTPQPLKWGVLPPVRAPDRPVAASFLSPPPPPLAATSQLDHIRTVILLT